MPILSLGPIELRFYSGDTAILDPANQGTPTNGWTNLELAFVTGRDNAGFSTRETAIKTGFKSDHLLEMTGEEDTSDTVVVNGTTYHGRLARGLDGRNHVLTARQVAAKTEAAKALKESKRLAAQAAKFAAGEDPTADTSAA